MDQLLGKAERGEGCDDFPDLTSTVVIAVQVHGAFDHRLLCEVSVSYIQNRLRLRFAQRSSSAQPSNNRFERSRGMSSMSDKVGR
jgi:hypothetical protein